jgi:hypothetical protein
MIVLDIAFILLALLPILIALLFRRPLIERKKKGLNVELREMRAEQIGFSDFSELAGIDNAVENYFSDRTILPPAMILSCLYLCGFSMCVSLIRLRGTGDAFPFYQSLIETARPVIFTFVGAYVFNVGAIIRRLYLVDLTDNVFWGETNRLLLSVGLAVTFLGKMPSAQSAANTTTASLLSFQTYGPWFFFSIPLVAPLMVELFVQQIITLTSKSRKRTAGDLPLRAVKGIDLWKQFRLEEEGVESVQNLATADVLRLGVRTHYNLRTLIDWIDQAMLISRFGDKAEILKQQCIAPSVIELAAEAPILTNDATFAHALADTLNVEPNFMIHTLNSLYQDRYVQDLWNLWQGATEAKPAAK